MKGYREELVQVAASALVAAQCYDTDTTRIDGGSKEGRKGKLFMEGLLDSVRAERERQELKWGSRSGRDAEPKFWLLVLLEEIGEVAEEINARTPGEIDGTDLVAATIRLGEQARAFLEAR